MPSDALPILGALLLRCSHSSLPVWPLPLPGARVAVMAGPSMLLEVFEDATAALDWVEAQRQQRRAASCPA